MGRSSNGPDAQFEFPLVTPEFSEAVEEKDESAWACDPSAAAANNPTTQKEGGRGQGEEGGEATEATSAGGGTPLSSPLPSPSSPSSSMQPLQPKGAIFSGTVDLLEFEKSLKQVDRDIEQALAATEEVIIIIIRVFGVSGVPRA